MKQSSGMNNIFGYYHKRVIDRILVHVYGFLFRCSLTMTPTLVCRHYTLQVPKFIFHVKIYNNDQKGLSALAILFQK